MSDQATRAAHIAELEAMVARSRAQQESQRARFEAAQAAFNLVLAIYVDAITAPMRALAEELREGPTR